MFLLQLDITSSVCNRLFFRSDMTLSCGGGGGGGGMTSQLPQQQLTANGDRLESGGGGGGTRGLAESQSWCGSTNKISSHKSDYNHIISLN